MKKSIFVKSALVLAMSAGVSTVASAGCGNANMYCGASAQSVSYAPAPRMVPFTSSAPMRGPVHLEGLGSNEFLQSTNCPVNVNGLESGQKVLGCYKVMKQTPRPVYQHVQVVHPIIYVRYAVRIPVYHVPVPVPTPIYHQPVYRPMPTCGMPMMPRPPMMGCRRW